MEEKGLDPKLIRRYDDSLSFDVTLPDGSVGILCIIDSHDGYWMVHCLNALCGCLPYDNLAWYDACSDHDLIGYAYQSDDFYVGAGLRIKPQSTQELELELSSFVTRIGMAVKHYRTSRAEHATPTGTSPD